MDTSIHEVSIDACASLAHYTENYFDESQHGCRDPFDILAELEEEQGYPINRQ